jgi:4-amino-4-deoxy-L-arabinose transferase-like glycosyltransferase
VNPPQAVRPPLPPPRFALYAALAFCVALTWLAVLPLRPLFNTDEGRYAEIPREMLESGDWVVPHLNGLPYIEKPPLQYWATAMVYRLLGEDAFSARLYTALSAFGGIAIVWLLARKLWTVETAWRAAAILSGMTLYLGLGQMLTLDMSLTALMTLCLSGFLLAQHQAERPGDRQSRPSVRASMWLAWAAAALGVLTKGLIAAAIPAAVLVLYTALSRDVAPWRRLHWGTGVPLFLAICVPWHWLAARRLPDFLAFFFVHEHFARYLTPVADRQESWWFFGAVFLAGSLPWTLPALRVLGWGWRHRVRPGSFNTLLFLWIWVAFILVFFSLSDSKLIPYVLPAMPALALLIAASPAAALRRDLVWSAVLTAVIASGAVAASLNASRLVTPSDRSVYVLQLAKPLLEIAAVLGVAAAFVLARRARDSTLCTVILGSGWCLALLVLMRAAAVLSPMYSGAGLAAAIPAAERGVPIYSVATYDQTLPFYLHRTVTLVAYQGELDYGLRHAPQAQLGGVDDFLRLWLTQSRAFAIMEISMFGELKSRGIPMREMRRDVHRVLVARS